MKLTSKITLPMLAVMLLLSAALTVLGQDPQEPPPDGPPLGPADLIPNLRLTPDQLQRIRQIQRDSKDERAAIGQRFGEAKRALDEALDASPLDEGLIEQRMQALAVAQNAQMRMRVQTEIRIRRVLTPEQLARLREIRLKAGDVLRARQARPGRPGEDTMRPNQRNGLAPLRRNNPLRNPRP